MTIVCFGCGIGRVGIGAVGFACICGFGVGRVGAGGFGFVTIIVPDELDAGEEIKLDKLSILTSGSNSILENR